MKKTINIILGIIFIALLGLRIYVIDSVSTAGTKYAELTSQLESRKQENEKLRIELLSLSSLNNLEAQATELGFANNSFEFLEQKSLALRQ